MTTTPKRKLLVTSALPYANGPIHIGHLVEYIQTDIWVRFQKLRGHDCYYMCADDAHGTPIMLSAQKQGISPEELIETVHKDHTKDFATFLIDFDHYYTTHSEENKQLSEEVYLAAKDAGVIYEKEIKQLYCPNDTMFLPDRFIKGTCPNCGAEDQYGDACEVCAKTYPSTDLKDPQCVNCGATPEPRETTHQFFKLSELADKVQNWQAEGAVPQNTRNKLKEWFDSGIKDWDITRDAPYFGFKIPGTEDKYFYVWMDAPIGYMASTQKWADQNGQSFEQIWKSGDFEIHHFIGKDILYFHTLFWPAMLMVAGYTLPKKINIHGFLTVNGEKMSKSRGTFIKAADFAEQINPEFLRYYYAAKLSDSIEDIDLNLEDFVHKLNSDVLGKYINIGSRLGAIITKKLDGKLSKSSAEGQAILNSIRDAGPKVAEYLEVLQFNKAMREIMNLADMVNKYINDTEPWSVVKTNPEDAREIITAGLNALRLLTVYLKPVLPGIAQGVETFLNIPPLTWSDLDHDLTDHQVNPYSHLAKRLDLKDVTNVVTPA